MIAPSRQFWVFAIVGAAATAAHYGLLIVLVQLFQAEATLSSTAGFALGAVVNYVLNYRVTFRSTRAHYSAIPRFIIAATSGMILNASLMASGVYILGLHYLLAQVVATVLVLFWNFAINKYWTFSNPPPVVSRNG